jgi:hypothetical protein
MRYQWLIVHRTKVAVTALMTAALIVSAHSGAPADAKQTSASRPEPASTAFCDGANHCFALETVNDNSNACNEIMGINDNDTIVGLYYSASQGCASPASSPSYSDFAALASPTPYTMPTPTLPTYPSFGPLSDGNTNISLQGLSTGIISQNFKNTYMVGYWLPNFCSNWCGVQYVNGTWTPVLDPYQGTGKCAITEVMAVNDSRMGVGFYEKNTGNSCTQHAFEYYPSNDLNNDLTYVDLSPPGGGNAAATSISQLGDVVGYVTQGSATSGWLYSDLKYYPINCCGSTGAYNTYPEAVNFSQGVAGYYVGNGTQSCNHYGFLT